MPVMPFVDGKMQNLHVWTPTPDFDALKAWMYDISILLRMETADTMELSLAQT